MTIKVNDEGLVIPKDLLDGVEEVEVRYKNGTRLVVVPSDDAGPDPQRDEGPTEGRSIFDLLGSDPIDAGPADAADRHDFYIYGEPSGDRSGSA